MERKLCSIHTDLELVYNPEQEGRSVLVRLDPQVGWSWTKALWTLLLKNEVRRPASSTWNPINLSSTRDMPVTRWQQKSDQLSRAPLTTLWVIVVPQQETSMNKRAQSRLTPFLSTSSPLAAFKTLRHKSGKDAKTRTSQVYSRDTSFE